MIDPPRLSVDLLRPYFKNMSFLNDRYSIEISIFSDDNQLAFEVSLDCKEPTSIASYPRRRFSFERHDGKGHEGVHVQINYHLIDNDLGIGRLYITLEIFTDEDLLHIGEGFVYVLYEILNNFNDDLKDVTEEIFNIELIQTIRERKEIFVDRMVDSLRTNRILISHSISKEKKIMNGEDLKRLIEERRELVPLIGPLIEP